MSNEIYLSLYWLVLQFRERKLYCICQFSNTKLYYFQNLSLGSILKMFLKFCQFQALYLIKYILIHKKREYRVNDQLFASTFHPSLLKACFIRLNSPFHRRFFALSLHYHVLNITQVLKSKFKFSLELTRLINSVQGHGCAQGPSQTPVLKL